MAHKADAGGVDHGQNGADRLALLAGNIPALVCRSALSSRFQRVDNEVHVCRAQCHPLGVDRKLLLRFDIVVQVHSGRDKTSIHQDHTAVRILGEKSMVRVVKRRDHVTVACQFLIGGGIALVIPKGAMGEDDQRIRFRAVRRGIEMNRNFAEAAVLLKRIRP